MSLPIPTHMPHHDQNLALVLTVRLAADGNALDPDLEARWANIKNRLSTVHCNMQDHPLKTIPGEWAQIYTDVAHLYSQNDAVRKKRMYVYVRQFIRELVKAQLQHLRPLGGVILLSEYIRRWQATMKYVRFMKRVLRHMQRFWISNHANTLKHDPIRPLDKLLMFFWREDLLSSLGSIVDIALELVDEHRRGNRNDCSIVRGIVDNFVELGAADISSDTLNPDPEQHLPRSDGISTLQLYLQVFEERFLEATRRFYKEEGVRMANDVDVSKFIHQLLIRLDEEEQRSRQLLHSQSTARVRKAAEEQLIGNHKAFLQTEATKMIEQGREKDLSLVYSLLTRIEGGLSPIRTFFVSYVRAEGNSVVVDHVDKLNGKEDIKHNLVLIEHLIRLYLKHANMVKRCFEASTFILLAIDDAFRGFVNRSLGPVSLPNLLAHYIDQLLKSDKSLAHIYAMLSQPQPRNDPLVLSMTTRDVETLKAKREEEGGEKLVDDDDATADYVTELVRFFMYLDYKDVFFETHRRLFAKRLLGNHDEDLETLFITKLRVQMGTAYTQRLSGMLQDIVVSTTLRQTFATHLSEKRSAMSAAPRIDVDEDDEKEPDEHPSEPLGERTRDALRIDFNGHVLNALHWPSVKVSGLRIPPVLKVCQSMFAEFYMQDKESRKLTWIHSMSTVNLAAMFGGTKYTFVVSTFQACTMLLFNDRKEISVLEAAKELNISPEELQRHIKPLLMGKKKYKVLSMRRDHEAIERRRRGAEQAEGGDEIDDGDGEDAESAANGNAESVGTDSRKRSRKNSACDNEEGSSSSKRMKSQGTSQETNQANKAAGSSSSKAGEKGGNKGEEGDPKELVEFEYLRVNEVFTSKHHRVVVPSSMAKLASAGAANGRNKPVMDRPTQVDAAIVRIMKSRRKMAHGELSAAVIAHLSAMRFTPDPKMFKTRLERLIDQEYIARDEEDARVYVYNA